MAKKKRKSTAQVNLGGDSNQPKPTTPRTQVYTPPEMSIGEILKSRWHLFATFIAIVLGSTYIFAIYGMSPPVQQWDYEVVNSFDHDSSAFTQGLLYHDGHLYESTGRYGESSIRKVEIDTGKPIINKRLADKFFGEGLVQIGDKLVQLTWKENRVFEYDLALNQTGSKSIETEGWGLTYDGKHLITTTGWTDLHYYDPETLEKSHKITVTQGASRIDRINEMEMVDGMIFANRLGSISRDDSIYIIDPKTAKVEGKADLSKLFTGPERPSGVDEGVMNGIAYNPEKGTFYVTGKNWPKIFEVKLFKKNK